MVAVVMQKRSASREAERRAILVASGVYGEWDEGTANLDETGDQEIGKTE